ncbi:hypothetical protein BD779DRAFT_1466370 [Infundibulicybe gibba]|nr:hypothetical protein BD779DRAFT_1466370 [Infundibulicybe gibba]
MSYSYNPWQQPDIVSFPAGGRDAQFVPSQSQRTHRRVSTIAVPSSSVTRTIIPIDAPLHGNILRERQQPTHHHQRRSSHSNASYPYPTPICRPQQQQHYPSVLINDSAQYQVPVHNTPRNPTHHRSHSTVTYLYPDGSTGRTPIRSAMITTPGCPISQVAPLTSRPRVRFQQESTAANSARDGPHGPTNHTRVPQDRYSETDGRTGKSYMDSKHRHKIITFQIANFPEVGVRVGDLLERESPLVVGCNDRVLDLGDREIKIKILWPGYEPYEKRLKTHSGTLDRATLVALLGNMIYNFASDITKLNIPIKRGYEEWAIGPQHGGRRGINPRSLIITALKHRGGSAWQPELWAPGTKL